MDAMTVLKLAFLAGAGLAQASEHAFVPACIARECSSEAMALGGDAYLQAFGKCASENFGPCASKAWQCLGDPACRSVVSCAPKVVGTCKANIWKMMTDPKERERLVCIANCNKDGKVDPICVLKCGKEALACLEDPTCRHAAECVPKAMFECTKAGFDCVFGSSGVCRENLECLGHGLGECADPAVNMLTDTRIANFVTCAGSKCPRPVSSAAEAVPAREAAIDAALPAAASPASEGAAGQLLCIAMKCGSKVAKLMEDQENKDLLTCAATANVTQLCSSVWKCLGDKPCADAVSCWTEPLLRCKDNVWHMLTNPQTRQGLARNVECLQRCHGTHRGDVTAATFCIFDECSKDLLACKADSDCWGAVQCLPQASDRCSMPTLDAYLQQPLFADSVKCLGRGLESCGRRAVSLVQNPDIAEAVQCAAQCTHQPSGRVELVV